MGTNKIIILKALCILQGAFLMRKRGDFMQYNFFIHNDKLIFNDHVNPRTGSVNVYECVFNINESVKGLQWFCVFNTEGINAIVTPIINNKCFIPIEVLKDENNIDIGCYATNGNTEDFKRINTNWLTFRPTKGAYMEGEAPETPSPDFWETLIFKTVPYIGDNGNWFIYDMESGQYKDAGKPSTGTGGGSVDLSDINKSIEQLQSELSTLSEKTVAVIHVDETGIDKAFEPSKTVLYYVNSEHPYYLLFNEREGMPYQICFSGMDAYRYRYGEYISNKTAVAWFGFNNAVSPEEFGYFKEQVNDLNAYCASTQYVDDIRNLLANEINVNKREIESLKESISDALDEIIALQVKNGGDAE